ncbi:MAG: mannose-1-phosphate guanylyltransferase/mannose-6-phosphate isomerase [Rhodocyclaceae bacterium]
MTTIQPVILSGGSGTRLWPLSREQYPKQLQSINGVESLIQETVLRLDAYADPRQIADPIIVSNEAYRFITAEQFRQIDRRFQSIILEPAGRNTAPALTVAARFAQMLEADDDPILLVMPADHRIRDPMAFCKAIETGADLAATGSIVTFGIEPDRAETEYGYLQLGKSLSNGAAYQLQCFIEKPDQETARRYVGDGMYLWNAGIFMMRSKVWLDALARYAPRILSACNMAYENGERDGKFFHLQAEAFLVSPDNSIGYAVMEPMVADGDAKNAAIVVPLDAGWSDAGAWDALWRASDKDEAGNATRGDVLLEGVDGSLVLAQSRLVACLGVQDLVIIETPDAVFVATKDRADEVKTIVARLKKEKRPEACTHRKKHRPWGYSDAIDGGDRFQVKRIVVSPKASLSLQMHHHRAEHWIVVRGTAQVTRGDDCFLVSENESTFIPLGVTHRLENPGMLPLEMIEVQSGTYLGEDDIVRLSDAYGHA